MTTANPGRVQWSLDEQGSFAPRPTDRVVSDDIAFLDLLRELGPALIQGMALCRWARVVGELRRIPTIDLLDPIDAIRRLMPLASDDQLDAIAARVRDHAWELAAGDVTSVRLLSWLEPGGPWAGAGTDEHLTRWLLWWADSSKDHSAEALVSQLGHQFAMTTEEFSASELYKVASQDEALMVLSAAAGLEARDDYQGTFTLGLIGSSLRQRLVERFRRRLVDGQVASTFLIDDVAPAFQAEVARAFIDRASSRRALDRREFEVLLRVLGPDALEPMRELLDVPDPGDVPLQPPAVLDWYRRHYVGWKVRYWRSEDPEIRQRIRNIEEQFEAWILDAFADIQQRPIAEGLSAWARSHRLRSRTDGEPGPTLLVITDGLAAGDIALINRNLEQLTSLTQVTDDVVFTRIPTVTEFTKSAIVEGKLAVHLVEEPAGRLTGIDAVIERLRNAKPDEVVAWTHVQPDHDYHFITKPEERSLKVQSSLREIAEGVRQVVDALGPTAALRLIITTDHGRYLGVSERTVSVPPGLTPHGRAAWGPGTSPNQNVDLRPEYVELNPTVFGLPPGGRYVVSRGSSAFVTSAGNGGKEYFTHGGLSPEEVIIPWVEYHRHVSMIPLGLTISGAGETRKAGSVAVTVTNPNEFTVELVGLVLNTIASDERPSVAQKIPVSDLTVPSMGQFSDAAIPVAPWPFVEQHDTVTVTLTYRLPSGQERRQGGTAEITTRSLYVGGLDLSDFGELD